MEINKEVEYIRQWLDCGGRDYLSVNCARILKYADHLVTNGPQFPSEIFDKSSVDKFYSDVDHIAWRPFAFWNSYQHDYPQLTEEEVDAKCRALMKLALLVKAYFISTRNRENLAYATIGKHPSYMRWAMPHLALLKGADSEMFRFAVSCMDDHTDDSADRDDYRVDRVTIHMAHSFLVNFKGANLRSMHFKMDRLISNLESALHKSFETKGDDLLNNYVMMRLETLKYKYEKARYSNRVTDWCDHHLSIFSGTAITSSTFSHPLFLRWGIALTDLSGEDGKKLKICRDCATAFLICHIHKTYVKQQTLFDKLWQSHLRPLGSPTKNSLDLD